MAEKTIEELIPNGIENFVPRCIVCTEPVSLKRSRGRSKATCSPVCNDVLKRWRIYVVQTSRCPNCYHPSSPEERDLFRQWRKDRGDRRSKRGRPPKAVIESESLGKNEAPSPPNAL
jgi:hypothetical protein